MHLPHTNFCSNIKLKNKIAVVTGGSRGIGRSIVEEFATEGAKVIFTYVKNEVAKDSVELEVKKKGGDAQGIKLDVCNFEDIEECKEKILDKFGKVDILVNNAGILRDKALVMMSKEDWRDVIDTNLNGIFNVTKNFIAVFMRQKQGSIINITSISGIIGMPRQVNYSASKGGIISFTKSLAREVAPFNIRVNAIAPGFINTDMTRSIRDDYVQKILPNIPLQRFGEPREVAKTAVFLAGDEANYITGQIINVSGGLGV